VQCKQQSKTLIHEYSHYLLHAKGATFQQEGSRIREAQAEAVTYVVMNHFVMTQGTTVLDTSLDGVNTSTS
jgi:Zn-dependent peptidase ImmA (M78 family)